MLAKEIMRRKVVAVERGLTLRELADVLAANGISGAPVVDESGGVLGVVSQTDLVRARREPSPAVPRYHREVDGLAAPLGIRFDDRDDERVERIMTPGAISFDQETPVEKLAEAMLARRVHRVLITQGDRLAGIVTTMDLLRALVALSARSSPPARRSRRR